MATGASATLSQGGTCWNGKRWKMEQQHFNWCLMLKYITSGYFGKSKKPGFLQMTLILKVKTNDLYFSWSARPMVYIYNMYTCKFLYRNQFGQAQILSEWKQSLLLVFIFFYKQIPRQQWPPQHSISVPLTYSEGDWIPIKRNHAKFTTPLFMPSDALSLLTNNSNSSGAPFVDEVPRLFLGFRFSTQRNLGEDNRWQFCWWPVWGG